MMLKNRLFIVLVLMVTFCFSQQQEYIVGKLLDTKTEEPIAFASIRIKDRALGIISNTDGVFKIPLKYKEYGDIIEISSIGYQTKEILIVDLAQDKLNLISLAPSAIDLQEAIVKGKDKSKRNLNAKQIVQKAIDAIPRNYPSTSFSTVGYYRDYQFKDKEYINLNEGILEVFDQGFDQLDDGTSETMLYNFQLNTDFKQDSMASLSYDYKSLRKIIKKAHLDAYGGNEFRILRIHDAIRNYNVGSYDFVGVLKTDLIKNHFFMRSRDVSINNDGLYNIKFWVFYPNYRANGNIYISMSDFAIHKLEYTMYDDKKWNDSRKKNRHGHRQKMIFDITTDYRKIGSKMYLNYISFHNDFILNIPPVFKVDYITVHRKRNCFVIEYNKIPESKPSMHIPNYKVEFKNRRVKIKRAERLVNRIYLYPKMDPKEVKIMIDEISEAEKKGTDLHDLLDVKVENVRDTVGNLVNKWTQRDYDQYREFFVQRVKTDLTAPLDNLFMDKKIPIFSDQPMTKPKDYKEYWINTPLQTKIN
ncbi:MAG: carboxypeptidase-like regulatory domain-containing protein [Maribacter sp.]